jgi:type I restriction enzyme M protein
LDPTTHNKLVNFIWSIADDCLRDVYVRGKYRDVILPMVVLRRLDALLEESKDAVMEEVRFQKEEMGVSELDPAGLKAASGYLFYNTSPWTLKRLYNTATNSIQLLESNFNEYLSGFSPNVQEIIEKFKLRAQIAHMAQKNILLDVLEKFTSPYINLSAKEATDPDGNTLPALSNLGMGYVFEELIRRFNEENNEEAGEHFTPREVIQLMTHIVFEPVKEALPAVMKIYDPACGSGGMLTESEKFVKDPEGPIATQGDIYLYGKEINDETYAICKSDMLIKGENPENIRNGSTLSTDEFRGEHFDFMLSNPPYGKSWASEQKYIKDGNEVIDPRFRVELADYWGEVSEVDAVPRSSDGQLLFLMEMVDKIKPLSISPLGSRIASVHNGSSLFTGDASSGESNIRRYIIENDYLEAIIQLPNNLFYNTGITTYIWILSNAKAPHRRGKIQLIDASEAYGKLRKNLGNKNCELRPRDIEQIMKAYRAFEPREKSEENPVTSKIFDNEDFGYYKVTIERPKRLRVELSDENIALLRYDKKLGDAMRTLHEHFGDDIYENTAALSEEIEAYCIEALDELKRAAIKKLRDPKLWQKYYKFVQAAKMLQNELPQREYDDFNHFKKEADTLLKKEGFKLYAAEKKSLYEALSRYDESAAPVIKKRHRFSEEELANLLEQLGCEENQLSDFGYYLTAKNGEYLEYESESDLRDSESIPLNESIHNYFLREVKPYVDEAWINLPSVKIGYEISFNRHFYTPKPLRSLEEVSAEILELEKESEGLIWEILAWDDEVQR